MRAGGGNVYIKRHLINFGVVELLSFLEELGVSRGDEVDGNT